MYNVYLFIVGVGNVVVVGVVVVVKVVYLLVLLFLKVNLVYIVLEWILFFIYYVEWYWGDLVNVRFFL